MISSHSCSELDANTRQSNVLPSGLSGEALKMETRPLAGAESGSESPALACNRTGDPAAGLDVACLFSKTRIPPHPPLQGPRAALTPRRRRINCCCPCSVPRRRWWGRGSGTGPAQGTGGRQHWGGLRSVPVVPIPGLNWPHRPSGRAPRAPRSAASGVTQTSGIARSPWKRSSPVRGLLLPSHQTKPPEWGMEGEKAPIITASELDF